MRNIIYLTALSLLWMTPHLFAEILQVSVFWGSTSCNPKCAELLEKNFKKMPQVEEVAVNPAAGSALFKWKAGSPFSYKIIKSQLQMAGVGVDTIRIRVRGQAVEDGKWIRFTSLGDKTTFSLISSMPHMPTKFTNLPNPAFLVLSPELKESILKDAADNKIIVIEGPLYRPHRSPPLYLIVEKIQVEKNK